MGDQVKVDFSKVTVEEYLEFQIGLSTDASFSALVEFGDRAVIGGIKDRPMTEIPMILSLLMKSLQEEVDNIAIAIASMQTYLKRTDDE